MCGKTDEDNLCFTYEQLDNHILGTAAVDEEVVEKIERLHKATRHKYEPMPTYDPHIYEWWELKQSKGYRGLRAKSGIIMDDCAGGGVIDPNVVTSIAGSGGVTINIDITPDPEAAISAALENNLNTADVIRSIEKEMWRSVMSNEIRGIK
jgi:hypothetical protein